MRTDILLHLINFFPRSVVEQIVVTVAPESNGTWNENQRKICDRLPIRLSSAFLKEFGQNKNKKHTTHFFKFINLF